MDRSFHRFQVGDFESICINDGTKDYVPKYLFNKVTEADIERALREKTYPPTRSQPFTHIFLSTPGNIV